MFGVTRPPVIGFETEGLTSEHRMEHHTWTRAMSDRDREREREYVVIHLLSSTHTNVHPQTHSHTPTHIHLYHMLFHTINTSNFI